MDIFDVFRQFAIHHQTSGDRHTSEGWVNCACPFCIGSPGLHLGFHLPDGPFNCWRCGPHRTIETFERLLRVDTQTARSLAAELRNGAGSTSRAPLAKVAITNYRRPSDLGPLRPNHKRYLARRGFDADYLEREYKLLGTSPVSSLDRTNYSYRIFIPIPWNDHKEVSFTTRSISAKAEIKYLSCPTERERTPHKSILFRKRRREYSDADWQRFELQGGKEFVDGIVVEGPFDVMRLDHEAVVGTFGTTVTVRQCLAIKDMFHRVAVIFDSERTALARARALCSRLEALGVIAFPVDLGTGSDPADLTPEQAAEVIRLYIRDGAEIEGVRTPILPREPAITREEYRADLRTRWQREREYEKEEARLRRMTDRQLRAHFRERTSWPNWVADRLGWPRLDDDGEPIPKSISEWID